MVRTTRVKYPYAIYHIITIELKEKIYSEKVKTKKNFKEVKEYKKKLTVDLKLIRYII